MSGRLCLPLEIENLDPSHPTTDSVRPVDQWIEAARGGCRASQNQLLDHCRGYLLAVARSEVDHTLRRKVAVSDVVQETMVRAQQQLAEFRGGSENEWLAWLRRIAINYVADMRRRYRQSEKRNVDREIGIGDPNHSTVGAARVVPIDSATPGRAVAAREEVESLRAALEQLSPEHRQVIALRSWERLPFAEVGRRMDRSSEAVRKLWARAVEQLGQKLRSSGESDDARR